MRLILVILLGMCFIGSCSTGEKEKDLATGPEHYVPDSLYGLENFSILPPDSDSQYEFNLVRKQNYGDKYDDVVYLGYINDFAVDHEGRVYLADMSNDQVHVYKPDGTFFRSIGRTGRGPGEFLTVRRGLDIGVNDKILFVYDETNFRISEFSLESYELLETINLEPRMWSHVEEIAASRPFRLYLMEDNSFLVFFRVSDIKISESTKQRTINEVRAFYYHFTADFLPDGEEILDYKMILSERVTIRGQTWLFSPPFRNRILTAVSGSGTIYKASSDAFLVDVYDIEGDRLRSFYRPTEPARVTSADLEKLKQMNPAYKRGLSKLDIPGTWPVLNQITLDDQNRMWISTITENQDSSQWWILNDRDQILGKLNWPRNLTDRPGDDAQNYIIKNGSVYHLTMESNRLDSQTVIRYRIEMDPI